MLFTELIMSSSRGPLDGGSEDRVWSMLIAGLKTFVDGGRMLEGRSAAGWDEEVVGLDPGMVGFDVLLVGGTKVKRRALDGWDKDEVGRALGRSGFDAFVDGGTTLKGRSASDWEEDGFGGVLVCGTRFEGAALADWDALTSSRV